MSSATRSTAGTCRSTRSSRASSSACEARKRSREPGRYRYVLIVGTLDQIRKHVYDRAERPAPPIYRFEKNRQHWRYHNAVDTGWPIRGELNVLLEKPDPRLIGPSGFWLAKDAPKLWIEAACRTGQTQAAVFWRRHDDDNFTPSKSVNFTLKPDAGFHIYEVDLSASSGYRGAITGLRFDPVPIGAKGDWIKIRSITFTRPKAP